MPQKKGFFGIGIWNYQYDCNAGTLWRSAYAFGADFLFTVGRKYKRQASDTPNVTQNLPYFAYESTEEFYERLPVGARVVCVEISDELKTYDLTGFVHPHRAVYVLGSETQTLPPKTLRDNLIVTIPTAICLNVSVAGSVVLYDRVAKRR